MENKDNIIQDLTQKIEQLIRRQQALQDEIMTVQRSVKQLQSEKKQPAQSLVAAVSRTETETIKIKEVITAPAYAQKPKQITDAEKRKPLEEFIGTNLLNKIGIAILVIGVGFGAKYAIDHQMLNAVTRIILGYTTGMALILVAFKLKGKFTNFSAVLLSGGMAILYFITYIAFDLYDLIPRFAAFGLMILFTVFTVVAAIQYNLEIIAIIGLTGAYAVPFLLSDGSGNINVLFSYVSIINAGILTLSFIRDWKKVFNIAFILTWLIYVSWFFIDYSADNFWTSLIFSTIFFLIFHITFLAYKVIRKELLKTRDIVLTLVNSFVYYGIGYQTFESIPDGDRFLGLFTLSTAFIYFISSIIIFRQKDRPRDTFYFAAGLVLVFLTLAIPVQLDGNWVTFLWMSEATVLFWIGRARQFPVYEKISYPLIVLAFLSLIQDWDNFYPSYEAFTSGYTAYINFLFNIQFLTTLLIAGALTFIYMLSRNRRFASHGGYAKPGLEYLLPFVIFITIYTGIYLEIATLWNQWYGASGREVNGMEPRVFNEDILRFKTMWLINYSAVFASLMCILNLKILSKPQPSLTKASLAFNSVVIVIFLTIGLLTLSDLRTSFLGNELQYFQPGYWHLSVRYVCVLFLLPLLWFNYRYVSDGSLKVLQKGERLFFHFTLLILLSSELLQWLDIADVKNSYKLGLSLLTGSYALILIIIGISRHKKYLRIAGIGLFALTLVKLFLYDLSDMSTIAKTTVMMVLGVLMLVASYLYNRYKDLLKNEID